MMPKKKMENQKDGIITFRDQTSIFGNFSRCSFNINFATHFAGLA